MWRPRQAGGFYLSFFNRLVRMIMRFSRLFCLVMLLFSALALTACGPSNTVPLLTPGVPSTVLPAPNAPRVSVVAFEDERDNQDLGVRRDGTAFIGSQNAAQWVSQSLADELRRNGLQVTYAQNADQARSGNPDYIVTGTLRKAWLKEVSSTELVSSMQASFRVVSRSGSKSNLETLNAGQTYKSLPGGDVAKDLMSSTLRDLIRPMGQKILSFVKK